MDVSTVLKKECRLNDRETNYYLRAINQILLFLLINEIKVKFPMFVLSYPMAENGWGENRDKKDWIHHLMTGEIKCFYFYTRHKHKYEKRKRRIKHQ